MHDVAVFLAEQAAQLYAKAAYFQLFGEKRRGHGLRELLGALARDLEAQGYAEQARAVRQFVVEYRDVLVMLEDAYIDSRYGEASYDEGDVSKAVEAVEKLMELLEGVVRDVVG